MKPVYVDRAHTFVKEEDKKKLKKEQKNKKDRKLTAREKRRLKIYDIPKEAHQYKLFEPLSKLWQQYMSKLLSQGTANFEQKLIKADFHGATMTGKKYLTDQRTVTKRVCSCSKYKSYICWCLWYYDPRDFIHV